MTGGAGADTFGFGGSAIGPGDVTLDPNTVLFDAQQGIYDTITDFAQGNTGNYDVNESDQLDVSKVVIHGQPVNSVVHVIEDASNTFAWLQVNTALGLLTLARLNGLHTGNLVNVITDLGLQSVTVQGPASPPPPPPPPPAVSVNPTFLGDYNHDGHGDLAWRSDFGNAYLWEMTGIGGSYAAIDLGIVSTSWHVQQSGDFNGDLKSDILWRSDFGDTYIWEMTGVGGNYAGVDLGKVSPAGILREPATSITITRAIFCGAVISAIPTSGR